MSGTTPGLSKRDRALAELVRVRGWADDAAIEKSVADASRAGGKTDLGSVLVISGLITPDQLQALENAIDGKSSRPRPPTRAPSASSDRTVARSDAVAEPAMPPSGIRKPPDQIGPYRVLRELGRGGMGVVYRALDPELRREVALKVMISGTHANEADVERFRREAAVVAKMGRHPNLIQIHDIGRDGDRLYFTMDFIEGRSAKQRVEEEGAFPPREAARIAAEMAGALAFAHAAGVLHRDVKPHNILLDREGKAFLGDFGLAKDLSANSGLTESGSAFGTPAYMSPEQAAGHASKATPLSDVYSLGATLFEMLTGRPPFVGESGMDIVRQVLDAEPPAPRTLREGIHRDLEIICLKALRKEPLRRYASAGELEADLRRFLNGEPILARPPGGVERVFLKVKRHRAIVTVALAGLVVAGVIGVGATWRIRVRDRQAKESKADLDRREKDATPLLLEGKSLVDRADEAAKSGGWKDRADYARRAVETLEKAKALLPESEPVRFELGRALRRAGREDEALKALEEAVGINAMDPMAWFEHGMICQQRLSRSRGTLLRLALGAVSNEVGFSASGFSGNVITWVGGTGAPVDEARLKETAAIDFRKVVETGAGTFGAAYGQAMLLFYEDKPEQALAKIDESIRINQYFADAWEARAEILETWKKDITAATAERRKLCELQPSNPEFLLEYALTLRATGKQKEGLDLARKAAERVDGNPDLVLRACQVFLQCGDPAAAQKLARQSLAPGVQGVNRGEAARLLVDAILASADPSGAAKAIEEFRAEIDPDWVAAYEGEIRFSSGDVPGALQRLRAVRPGSPARQAVASFALNVEQAAGNLDLAGQLAREAATYGLSRAYRMVEGLFLLERGKLDEALAAFEEVRKAFPKLNANLSNIAAAKFLLGDYAGSLDAMEESVAATPLPKAQRDAARKNFEALRKRLSGVKERKDAAKIVEEIVGFLALATLQAQDKSTQAAIREGMRGLLRVLQQFYSEAAMVPESIRAAESYLAITRTGSMLFRLAAAKAAAGDAAGALAALRDAEAAGFDDGSRVEGEAAFAGMKENAEFVELRKKCR
ncbi:MAG: protein kinase [Planctomycetes bacterium]|nr:protein kinase [Planctomycetota bacterium]